MESQLLTREISYAIKGIISPGDVDGDNTGWHMFVRMNPGELASQETFGLSLTEL